MWSVERPANGGVGRNVATVLSIAPSKHSTDMYQPRNPPGSAMHDDQSWSQNKIAANFTRRHEVFALF